MAVTDLIIDPFNLAPSRPRPFLLEISGIVAGRYGEGRLVGR